MSSVLKQEFCENGSKVSENSPLPERDNFELSTKTAPDTQSGICFTELHESSAVCSVSNISALLDGTSCECGTSWVVSGVMSVKDGTSERTEDGRDCAEEGDSAAGGAVMLLSGIWCEELVFGVPPKISVSVEGIED